MLDSISVLSLASNIVNLVFEAVKAFEEVSKRFRVDNTIDVECRELELQLKVAQATIVQWKNIWFQEADKSNDFFLTLWGQSGENRIRELLRSISTDCRAIQKFAEDSTDLTENLVKRHNVKRPSKSRNWPSWLRSKMKMQMDKAMDIQIRENVVALSRNIDELWTSSELHFRSLHGVQHGSDSPENSKSAQALLRQVLVSRHASTSLYWHCQAQNVEVDLDMNLLDNDLEFDKAPDLFDWADLNVSYHLIWNPSDSALSRDVFIEPDAPIQSPGPDDVFPDVDCEATLETAIQQTCTEHQLRLPAHGNASELYVNLTCRTEGLHSDSKPKLLQMFASDIHKAEVDQIACKVALPEKMSLAYRIAHCALFLLGTPWLSHLSSNSLRRLKTSNIDYQYSLHIEWSSQPTPGRLSPVALERSQIFQLGILLLEIALETNFSTVDSHSIQTRFIPSVSSFMGPQYTHACEFCLSYKNSEENVGIQTTSDDSSMLQKYYSEVFIP